MDIKQQVEKHINEQGRFNPMDWLIDMGRLMYSDYEKWRNAEETSLDTLLLGDIAKITQQVSDATSHALALGLQQENMEYRAWSNPSSQALKISDSKKLSQLLAQQLVRAHYRCQRKS